MRSYKVNTQPVQISVNGKTFDLLKADAIAQAEIIQYISDTGKISIAKPQDVEIVLRAGCDLIDSLLGGGACFEIWGKNPVSLGQILSLLTKMCKDCREAYRAYLESEYSED